MVLRRRFWATKKIYKPVRVKFVNKYGEVVSFEAKKIIKVPVKVDFYAYRRAYRRAFKRRRW